MTTGRVGDAARLRQRRLRAAAARLILCVVTFPAVIVLLPESVTLRWFMAAFTAGALGFYAAIFMDIGGPLRPLLAASLDVLFITYVVHRIGSQSVLVAAYVILAMANGMVVPPWIARTVALLSAGSYAALAIAESAHLLPYAPDVPELHSRGPSFGTTVFATVYVSTAIGVAAWVSERVAGLLRTEMAKSDALLLNVLPEAIADRLKEQRVPIADSFSDVTVLFADVAGFTPMSSTLTPEQVVDMLNRIFHEFDDLAERHHLEKIKTIGDAYMVAGGLPEPRADHAVSIAEMALGMIHVPARLKVLTGDVLNLRIGIHTGPVVAGVIGKKKFSYDLWGDTVNTASRMESHGVAGRIHVTFAVYEKLKELYEFEERGVVSVKGKGDMTTYFLVRKREAAA